MAVDSRLPQIPRPQSWTLHPVVAEAENRFGSSKRYTHVAWIDKAGGRLWRNAPIKLIKYVGSEMTVIAHRCVASLSTPTMVLHMGAERAEVLTGLAGRA